MTAQLTPAQRRIMDRIELALAQGGGTHAFYDVMEMLLDGRAQWWQHGEGIVITELRQQPQFRELSVWLVAGHLPDCAALQPRIEAFAREHGCVRAIGIGRRGWVRAARAMGFTPSGVELRRNLTGLAP